VSADHPSTRLAPCCGEAAFAFQKPRLSAISEQVEGGFTLEQLALGSYRMTRRIFLKEDQSILTLFCVSRVSAAALHHIARYREQLRLFFVQPGGCYLGDRGRRLAGLR
jgi:hypothetical protein